MNNANFVVPLCLLFLVVGLLGGFIAGREYEKRQQPQVQIDVPGFKLERR